jgi:hypothetical protein
MTNRSMSFLTNGDAGSICGTSGRAGTMYAQWSFHFAPCATHCVISSVCRGVSGFFPAFFGGMRNSSSSDVIRITIRLSSVFPGTTGHVPSRSPNRPSFVSSRSGGSAFRLPESGPWQV